MSNKQTSVTSIENEVINLFFNLTIGASGAVSKVAGAGVKSITKLTDAGAYEIELTKATRFLSFSSFVVSNAATGSGVATIEVNENPANLQADFKADGKIKIQFRDVEGAKVNAESGTAVYFTASIRKSSVGPFDK